MPIRGQITWGRTNPFRDPRLAHFDDAVVGFMRGKLPQGWKGNRVWENRWGDLPERHYGHYREFYMGDSQMSGDLRVVIGRNGEVYLSDNHHHDWWQIVGKWWNRPNW
ncbi:MAG: hypothetical protein JNJ88_20150 [Planctomycetes bacterium]|nr:hypothetical protein [Planctomycetota bacterium]